MITRQKVVELLRGLELKTVTRQVRWNPGENTDLPNWEFYVAFPEIDPLLEVRFSVR